MTVVETQGRVEEKSRPTIISIKSRMRNLLVYSWQYEKFNLSTLATPFYDFPIFLPGMLTSDDLDRVRKKAYILPQFR